MKRFCGSLILLLFFFSGCAHLKSSLSEPVSFYYLERDYGYGQTGSVIAVEERESSGHRRHLSYMMALYLMGPTEEEHIIPLPAGTRIGCTLKDNGDIQLELSDAARVLSDSEYTLACTCLSLTCFDLTDSEKVTVINGERSLTMNRGSFTLSDDISSYPTTEETK